MTDLKLVQFPTRNVNDIPAMMRAVADDIEAGNYGTAVAAICVLESEGGLNAFAWGTFDPIRAVGLMHCGASVFANSLVDEE